MRGNRSPWISTLALLAACSASGSEPGDGATTTGSEAPPPTPSYLFGDYQGTWHGLAEMPAGPGVQGILLVVQRTGSRLCERPGHDCHPAEVEVNDGHLHFHAEVDDGETLEGRLLRGDGEHLLGTVRSSACDCEGDANLALAEAEDFNGTWHATISFNPVHAHEDREFPLAFRSPKPFELRVSPTGVAQACERAPAPETEYDATEEAEEAEEEAEQPMQCVVAEWQVQGPQAAFSFARRYGSQTVTTEGVIARMSNGQIEGDVLRRAGDLRREGRIYLRASGEDD